MAARPPRVVLFATALLAALAASPASAEPALRRQEYLTGDFALIGNTLAHDCAGGAPVVGTVSGCGTQANDSGVDFFWVSNPSTGTATANAANVAAQSSAMLDDTALPPGSSVVYARLYWAGHPIDPVYGASVSLLTPGGAVTIAADVAASRVVDTDPDPATTVYWYQSSANVTSLLQGLGDPRGRYTLSGAASVPVANVSSHTLFAAWWMVVFYSNPAETALRQVTLFDGLDYVEPGAPADVTLSGFLVPNGFDAKLGVVTYEGDSAYTGDALQFRGYQSTGAIPSTLTTLTDARNPANNFFNRTRSWLGTARTVAGDLPQYSGTSGSMQSLDLDVVDLEASGAIHAGDDAARIRATTSQDVFALGAFITSILTYRPSFIETVKTATELPPADGSIFAGDVIEYLISTRNSGNDPSVQTEMVDVLPVGVTYVPGSMQVTSPGYTGNPTDAAGDDVAEYVSTARTVRVRLGAGATAWVGGTVGIGETAQIRFRVTVNPGASGVIQNRAEVVGAGQSGEPPRTFPSNPPLGTGPTDLPVDQCLVDAHCGGATPACWTDPTPSVCVGCTTDAFCGGATPRCDLAAHVCVGDATLSPTSRDRVTEAAVGAPFPLALSNLGLPDIFELDVSGCASTGMELRDAGGTTVATRSGGAGPWTVVLPAVNDGDGDGLPDLGETTSGGTTSFTLWLTPDGTMAAGAGCAATVTATGSTGLLAAANVSLRIAPAATWTPDYTGTSAKIVSRGGDVGFPGVIQNATSGPLTFALQSSLAANPDPGAVLAPAFWSDPNGDGDPSDGTEITSVGPVAAYGGTARVVLVLHASTAGGVALDTGTILTATSTATDGGVVAAQAAVARVQYAATYSDAGRTLVQRRFSPCATVHLGTSLLPSGSPYLVEWYAKAAPVRGTDVPFRSVDPWTVSGGVGADDLQLPANALGTWTVVVVQKTTPTQTEVDRITFEVERAGSFSALAAPGRIGMSGGLSVSATVQSENVSAGLTGTQLAYTVTDGASLYLDGEGAFTTAQGNAHLTAPVAVMAGATASDAWAIAVPAWPGPGVYHVDAEWQIQCGGLTQVIAPATTTFQVIPEAPVITSPPASPPVATSTPTFAGTGIPGAALAVEVDGAASCSALVGADGSWTCTALIALAQGPHTAIAIQTVAGATSDDSAAVGFTVDTAPPAVTIGAPTPGALLGGGVAPGGAVAFAGTAEAGTTVTVAAGAATAAATLVGTSWTASLTLVDGTYVGTATATDGAGNSGTATVSFTVDLTPPAPPLLAAVPTPTNDDPIAVSGSAEADATVELFLDGASQGTQVAGPAFAFSLAGVAADASHTVVATARDPAGNLSGPSAGRTFYVDRTAPGLVDVAFPADGALLGAAAAPGGVVAFSGTSEIGSSVEVRVNGVVCDTVLAGAGGDWSASCPVLEGANAVDARAADAAGNVGAWSASNGFTLDSAGPLAPELDALATPTASGAVTVTGTVGDLTATVGIYVDGAFAGTATGAGGFSLGLSVGEGTYVITARAMDPAGNRSALSNAVPLVVDETPPATPVLDPIVTPTNAVTVTVSGTTDPGTVVTVYRSGVAVGTASEAGGSFSLDVAVGEGSFSFTARAADAAGNSSALSGARDVEVDRTASGAPVLDPIVSPTNATSLTVAGTAEAGTTVTVRQGGVAVGTSAVSGGRFAVTVSVAEGTFSFTATAADPAGNVSPVSNTRTVEVDQTVPAAPTLDPLVTPTNAASVVVRGGSDAGTTVTIRRDGVAVASASVSGGRFAASVPVFAGTVTFTATAADAAGNVSPVSNSVTIEVDHTLPAVPTLDPLVTPTNGTSAVATGHADAGATVTLLLGGLPAGAAVVAGDGTFSIPVGLSDGSNVLTATAADSAGNVSDPSAPVTVVVDQLDPDAPILGALDSPTGASTVTVAGSAEAGGRVTIYRDGLEVGTVTVPPGGTFALDVGVADDGTFTFTATAQDAAGNVSLPSLGVSVVVDHALPAPPVLAALASPTNATTVTVSGTAEAGATVTVSLGGSLAGSVVATGGTFSLPVGVPEGDLSFTAVARDLAGNLSAQSNTVFVTVDRTAPAVPVVVAPASGALLGAAAAPGGAVGFAGTSDPSTSVVLEIDAITTTLAAASGAWATSLVLADGPHTVRARAFDAVGNGSSWSASSAFTLDTTAPAAPVLDPLVTPTNAATIRVTGAAEPGASVAVFQDGVGVGTATATGGAFSLVVATAEGAFSFTAVATDAAGNVSPTSGAVPVAVDRTAPLPPVLEPVPTPTGADPIWITCSAEPGATVILYLDGALWGSGSVCDFPLAGVSSGSIHRVDVVARDPAGNLSGGSSVSFFVDREPPGLPTILEPADGDVLDATEAPAGVVSFSGTAELFSTVEVQVDGDVHVVSAAGGSWHLWLPLDQGGHAVRARVIDSALNVGAWSGYSGFVIDSVSPLAPVLDVLATPTSAAIVTVTGTVAEVGATVGVYVDGAFAGTATGWSGFSLDLALAEGTYALTARAIDTAGNASLDSEPVALTVDRTPPAAPVLDPLVTPTNAASVIVSGATDPGTVVTVYRSGVAVGTASEAGGSFSLEVAVGEGSFSFTARAADAAGNSSALSNARDVEVDRTAPGAPVLDPIVTPTNATSLTIAGTAEAGTTVTVRRDGSAVGTSAVTGGRFALTLPVGEGTFSFTAIAADAAENVSAVSNTRTVEVDRAAPAAPSLDPLATPTNASTVVVRGGSDAGTTVTIRRDGLAVATAPVAAGRFSASVPVFAGTVTFTATATDAAGNVSPVSNAVTIEVDHTLPAVPTLDPLLTPTNGTSAVVTGHADAGATVTLLLGGLPAGAAVVAGDGTFSIPVGLSDGTNVLTATSADSAGNVSDPSAPVTVAVDQLGPDAPILAALDSPTGASTVSVVGSAEAGSLVTVYRDGAAVGTTTATGGAFALDVAVSAGTHSFVATARDAAGNVSVDSNLAAVVVDHALPAPPVLAALTSPTNATTVTVSGTAEPGSTVTVLLDGSPVGTVAAGTGPFSLPVAVHEGDVAFTATSRDAVGHVSASSNTVRVTVDRTAPATPDVVSPARGAVLGAAAAPDGLVTFAGTTDAGTTVLLDVDGATSALPDAAGTWSANRRLADGGHQLRARALDAAGNASAWTPVFAVTVDTLPPPPPQLDPILPGSTSAATVTVSGVTEAGAVVTLQEASWVGTVTAAGDGRFSVVVPLDEGWHGFVAYATDAAGNGSPYSNGVTVVVDRTAPAAPVLDPLVTPTNAAAVVVTGAAETGAAVTVLRGGAPVGTVTAAGGTFSLSVAVPEGTSTFTATATDAASNTSPASNAVAVLVDRTAPLAPVLAAVATPTRAVLVGVSGSAEAGAVVELFLDGVSQGTQPAAPAFTFSLAGVAEGSRTVTAVARDAAGNPSPASTPVTFFVDRTAPGLATVDAPANGAVLDGVMAPGGEVTFSGTSEAGSTVEVDVDGVVLGITSAAGGGWSEAFALSQGLHQVRVRATDAAGNPGGWSGWSSFTVDSVAPAAPVLDAPASPTSAAVVTVTGTIADLGATVGLYVDGAFAGTATGAGGFAFELTLAEGTYTLTARALDAAGNRSAVSNAVPLAIDRTAPAEPAIDPIASPTSAAAITVTGTTDAGTVVSVYLDGALAGTTVESGGRFSLAVTVGEGSRTFTATAADAAANASGTSNAVTLLVDRTAPAAPAIDPLVTPTSATAIPVTGTTDANTTVTIYRDGVAVGTATGSGGRFSLVVSVSEGSFTFTATAADAAGNTSGVSNARTVLVDRAAPSVPTLDPIVTPTNAASVTVSGTAEAGATVTILRDGVPVATAPVSGGRFSATVPVFDGAVTFTATATDAAGNVSPISALVVVVVDHGVPATPTLDPLVTPTTGATATVTGRADAGSTVTLLVGGVPAGVGVAAGDGTFAIPVALSDGANVLTATSADAAGNVSPPSAPLVVQVDRVAPDAPLLAALDSPTGASTVSVVGAAEAGSLVTVYRDGAAVGTTVAISGTFVLDVAVTEGTRSFVATATDAAGNGSDDSNVVTVVVDHSLPVPPVLAALTSPTNATTVSVSGTAEPGSIVTVFLDGAPVGTVAAAGGSGAFTLVVAVPEGVHAVTATSQDAVGHVSAASSTVLVAVDRTAPAAPSLDPLATPTSAPSVPVGGQAEPGATVAVLIDGVVVGTTVAGADGSWSVPVPVADGGHTVTAIATDPAGNASGTSEDRPVTVDTQLPAAPSFTRPVAGATLSPGATLLEGTAEAGATVQLVVGGRTYTTTAGADGRFSVVTAPLAVGTWTATATAVDAAGNASAPASVTFSTAAGSPDGHIVGGGCGCTQGGGSPASALLLVAFALVLVPRRRVRPEAR